MIYVDVVGIFAPSFLRIAPSMESEQRLNNNLDMLNNQHMDPATEQVLVQAGLDLGREEFSEVNRKFNSNSLSRINLQAYMPANPARLGQRPFTLHESQRLQLDVCLINSQSSASD